MPIRYYMYMHLSNSFFNFLRNLLKRGVLIQTLELKPHA
jgi:hypothetical protein